MRISESRLRSLIRNIVVESWRDHSSIESGGMQMLAKGYGSKIYGNAEEYFTLKIELTGSVDAKWALEGIEKQHGEIVSNEGNIIVAKFPYMKDGKTAVPKLVADNLAFWIGR
tara:strand:+ start:51 stop:389 length:339 start_codon:yes stop_codon:yes gene_type:complete